ncbi:MAG: energy-coupled thiamine transporter ThiT [Anaerorhabdus sp.]
MKIKDLSYMALYAALALVLEYVSKLIPILQMPNGGSINLGVVAVVVASFHLSWKKGVVVGLLWWLIAFFMGMNNWYLNFMQYSLDYLVPVAACGLASIFPRLGKTNIYLGSVLAMILRFASFVLSGVYFWPPEGSVAGSFGAWIYSLSYNFGYNFVTLIIVVILVPLCINRLSKVNIPFKGVKKVL